MQVCIGVASFIQTHFFFILLLQLVPAQVTPPPDVDSPSVMKFMDVWTKSMCQPMEQLVNVEQEFPGEVEHIYVPACVPLKRCSGFCMDEALQCLPTLTRNITVQMQRITPNRSSNMVELTFVEHQSCECRARQNMQQERRRNVTTKSKPQRINRRASNDCGRCQYSKKISLH